MSKQQDLKNELIECETALRVLSSKTVGDYTAAGISYTFADIKVLQNRVGRIRATLDNITSTLSKKNQRIVKSSYR
jgi:hypothetical protein